MVKTGDALLRIELEDGHDPELLERLTNELKAELLEEEVAETIEAPKEAAPEGAKVGLEALEIGALSLQIFVYSVKAIEVIVKALKSRGLKGSLESPNGARLNLAMSNIADQESFLKSVS